MIKHPKQHEPSNAAVLPLAVGSTLLANGRLRETQAEVSRARHEVRLFFTALMFLTRIPCPSWIDYSEEYLNKASRYFPLMGWIVGGCTAFVFWLSSFVMPSSIAILLSMVTSILLTGALHEDGFADFCDGFGGGWTKEQVLTIMKDSSLGTYGTTGICLLLALKYLCLMAISPSLLPSILIAGHSMSRLVATSFISSHEYVWENENSKPRPLPKQMSRSELVIAGFFGIMPFFLLEYYFLLLLIPVFIAKRLLGKFFVKRIGGYTGDCLGAAQQVSEVIFYLLSVMQPWKYF